MIKEIACPTCDGYGEYWDNYFGASYPCETCGGPGWIYQFPESSQEAGSKSDSSSPASSPESSADQ